MLFVPISVHCDAVADSELRAVPVEHPQSGGLVLVLRVVVTGCKIILRQEDGLATVAWVRSQPWCDGRVATAGASYLGHTQWAVAPYVDPPLLSVSLNITAAKITAAFYNRIDRMELVIWTSRSKKDSTHSLAVPVGFFRNRRRSWPSGRDPSAPRSRSAGGPPSR